MTIYAQKKRKKIAGIPDRIGANQMLLPFDQCIPSPHQGVIKRDRCQVAIWGIDILSALDWTIYGVIAVYQPRPSGVSTPVY